MKRSLSLLFTLFIISTISYGQIHRKKSKFSIGLTATHYSVDKLEEISFLYKQDDISYRIGNPSVNLYGAGLKMQYQIISWLSLGGEFSFNTNKVENTAVNYYSQEVTTIEYGGFMKIYPFAIRDAIKTRKFMFYIPFRIYYSNQTTDFEYFSTFTPSLGLSSPINGIRIGQSFNYSGISYSIVGVGADFHLGEKFIINAEVTDDFEFADTRRFSLGLLFRF